MKEKVILFNGENLDSFVIMGTDKTPEWRIENGAMTVTSGHIVSKEKFGDSHIHVEFNLPYMPEAEGQMRANSGVYVQGIYEVQILDSYGKEEPRYDDCGGIYSQVPPLTNACAAPGEWQTYDIILKTAKLDADGSIVEAAKITVIHNGKVIHNNYTLPDMTPGGLYKTVVERGPLLLQDHGCPVSFRNVWVQPL